MRTHAPSSGLIRCAIAATLATVVAGSCSAALPPKSRQANGEQRLSLTSEVPEVTRRVDIRVEPAGQRAATVAEVVVEALPINGREPVEISVVRESDGSPVALGPFREAGQVAAIGRSFAPFESCGPVGSCLDTFIVTLRLVGPEPVDTKWRAQMLVEFPDSTEAPLTSSATVTLRD